MLLAKKCIPTGIIPTMSSSLPHLLGVIPKAVIDSMEYLMNFHFLKDVRSKRGNKKWHSFKGKTMTLVNVQTTQFKLCLSTFKCLTS